jgi:hypothetical protein
LDDGNAGDRRNPKHVDPGRTRGRCIFRIRAIGGNIIADNQVDVEVLPGRGRVQVERDTGQAITYQSIADDHISGSF